MDMLNQMELQNIRHTCGACCSLCDKIKYYKTITNDQNALELMDKVYSACDNLKKDLVGRL